MRHANGDAEQNAGLAVAGAVFETKHPTCPRAEEQHIAVPCIPIFVFVGGNIEVELDGCKDQPWEELNTQVKDRTIGSAIGLEGRDQVSPFVSRRRAST